MTADGTGHEHSAAAAPGDGHGYKHRKTVVALLVVACILAPIAGTSILIILAVLALILLLVIEVLGRAPATEVATPTSAT